MHTLLIKGSANTEHVVNRSAQEFLQMQNVEVEAEMVVFAQDREQEVKMLATVSISAWPQFC